MIDLNLYSTLLGIFCLLLATGSGIIICFQLNDDNPIKISLLSMLFFGTLSCSLFSVDIPEEPKTLDDYYELCMSENNISNMVKKDILRKTQDHCIKLAKVRMELR